VRRDTYRDSVELMRVAAEVERLPGVISAALLMGTPTNLDLLAAAGLLVGEAADAGPNDLVVALAAADREASETALAEANRLLVDSRSIRSTASSASAERPPQTIANALARLPSANLAIISTPGRYATAEALKALKRGLHVFLFSNNVPIEDEIELKQLARARGLLLMGPDCGTAILDGVPLGFANVVRRGRIGLVGASGTGLQQVSCLIDRLGEGTSQVIGVGGRDLDERVGGCMMLGAIERLASDADTSVIVLVSKPPSSQVARRIMEAVRTCAKPTVANFMGAEPDAIREAGAVPAATLEDAASLAVALARGESTTDAVAPALDEQLADFARQQASRMAAGQRYVRGLYSGGTLSLEAALILGEARPAVHTTVDLGADEFTVGRPHPMIDFRLRNERIVAAAEDPTTAVILLDVVLGYGSHPDPASALLPAIGQAQQRAASAGCYPAFVASVCGTPEDPQGLENQERRLSAAGLILARSNARAARLAARIAAEAEVSSTPPAVRSPTRVDEFLGYPPET
jgi:succinyl-CoA synthetase alpha subunit